MDSVNNLSNQASAKANKNWNKAKDYTKKLNDQYKNTKESVNNLSNQASAKATQHWNELNESIKNNKSNQSNSEQIGGQIGGFKKIHNENKKIENRINNSLYNFLYIKRNSTSKKKIKSKSNTFHKTKRINNKNK